MVLPSGNPGTLEAWRQQCSDGRSAGQGLLAARFPAQVATPCFPGRLCSMGCKADKLRVRVPALPRCPTCPSCPPTQTSTSAPPGSFSSPVGHPSPRDNDEVPRISLRTHLLVVTTVESKPPAERLSRFRSPDPAQTRLPCWARPGTRGPSLPDDGTVHRGMGLLPLHKGAQVPLDLCPVEQNCAYPQGPSRTDLPRPGLCCLSPSLWASSQHPARGAGLEPEASGGRMGVNSGVGAQALLSDPQMCSSYGDQPGPAVGLLLLFQELLGGESLGPSAAEEQRSRQKPSSLLRGLALTQPRWRDAVGSLAASGVQI